MKGGAGKEVESRSSPYKSLASVAAALESVCQNPTSVGNVPAFLLSDQDVGCLRGVTRSSRLSVT